MFIPKKSSLDSSPKERMTGVHLKNKHVWMSEDVVAPLFGEEQNAYLAYYPEQRCLVLSPVSNQFFPNLHEASQHMLKAANLLGDRSLALHELLIDHELDLPNGPLRYETISSTRLLKVYFDPEEA